MPQIGAIFYIAWGLLHLYAAFQVSKLGKRQKAGMVQGRIYQSVWNLAALAVAVIAVAAVYNWFNNPAGYWLNLALTSVTDVGFILFVLVPGYLPLWPGPTALMSRVSITNFKENVSCQQKKISY